MPSKDEYQRGKRNLLRHGYQVDYVLTHTVSESIARKLVEWLYSGEEELQDYFEDIANNLEFRKWYFGHRHMDCEIGNFVGLYHQIERIQ